MRPSTLIPDVDNAAVGNAFDLLQESATKGILLFLFYGKEGTKPHLWRTEGERLESCISAMGSRVSA